MIEVRITQPKYEQLEKTLWERTDVETKCFFMCNTLEHEGNVALLVKEIVPVPDDAYEERSAAGVVVKPEFVHKQLVRCAEYGYSLNEAHTHLVNHRVHFSGIDMRSDRNKFEVTQCMSPSFRHATMVFGKSMGFEGHIWDYEKKEMLPIDKIKIIGSPLEVRYPTDAKIHGLEKLQKDIFDRQIRAFGEQGQKLLRDITVGIGGMGGLGLQIGQALSLLGVGHIIAADMDNFDTTSSQRAVGMTKEDILNGSEKVKAFALRSSQILNPPEVTPIVSSLKDAWKSLLFADVLIGAVDSADGRHLLNLISNAALIPYIDGGVGLRANEGNIESGGGQVRVVLPDVGFCLACHDDEAQQRTEERMTPEEREEARRRGYIQGADIKNPQVVFLNGIVGNMLVWEFVKLVTGCLPVKPYVYYDLLEQQAFPIPDAARREGCMVCDDKGYLAAGQEAIGEYIRLSYAPKIKIQLTQPPKLQPVPPWGLPEIPNEKENQE